MRNYLVVPLGKDENGKTIYLRLPQDQTLQFAGGMLWELFKVNPLATRGKAEPWQAFLQSMGQLGGEVPSVNPLFQAVADLYDYALAKKNPHDAWRHRPAIRPSLFEADTWETDLAFFKYLWNNVGGGAIHRWPSSYAYEREQGSLEKVLSMPGLSNTVGRLLRVSDYGERELEAEQKAEEKKNAAREREKRRRSDGTLDQKARVKKQKRAFSLFK
jgi:hypothetical protein